MIIYKGNEIILDAMPGVYNDEYTISRHYGRIWRARCAYGMSYAILSRSAVEGAKGMINQHVQ